MRTKTISTSLLMSTQIERKPQDTREMMITIAKLLGRQASPCVGAKLPSVALKALSSRGNPAVLSAVPQKGVSTSFRAFGSQNGHFRSRLLSTASKKESAVQAPDGISDALQDAELHEAEGIIHFAATHEKADLINKQHAAEAALNAEAMKDFAVEAPVDMINQQHTEEAVLNAERMKTFAVEAPDGSSDALLNAELHEVEGIVDFAATHENADMINRQHVEEAALVADGMRLLDAQFQKVGYLGEFAATQESVAMINKQHAEEAVLNAEAMQIFAVEAPDGSSDALLNAELHEVEDIVDYAATHENADMINRQHAEEAALVADGMRTFAVEASDGSSDAELDAELHEVEDIVEFAAMHEDVDMINSQHAEEAALNAEGMKTFAVVAPDGTSDALLDTEV
jgi:hypothetical protein